MTAHAIKTELLVAESRESLHQTSLELKVPDPELEHGLAAIKENTILTPHEQLKSRVIPPYVSVSE